MNPKIKISQLPAKGANLAAEDLLEVAEFTGTGYVSKSITGQEIIDAATGSGVTAVTGTAPIESTGGTTPDLSIRQSGSLDDGYLSSADWIAFNNKQDALVSGTNIKTVNSTSLLGSGNIAVQPTLVSGTNIKTINGSSVLGSGNLTISGGVTSVTGTAPIVSSGGATPAISISTANTTTTGALSSTDWNTFNGKQAPLVSGTNIRTINGNSVLGSGNLTIGGGGGIHAPKRPSTGQGVNCSIYASTLTTLTLANTRVYLTPFCPATSFNSASLNINVTTAVATSLSKIVVYSDLNGLPNTLLYNSSDLDCSTLGVKTATTTFSFVAGTTYWLGTHNNFNHALSAIPSSNLFPISTIGTLASAVGGIITAAYVAPPNPIGSMTYSNAAFPHVWIIAA